MKKIITYISIWEFLVKKSEQVEIIKKSRSIINTLIILKDKCDKSLKDYLFI